jgi:hypothetical protein
MASCSHVGAVALAVFPLCTPTTSWAQTDPDQRIFGVIPNFQTVSVRRPFKPLTVKGKWNLFVKETVDRLPASTLCSARHFSDRNGGEVRKQGVAYVKRSGTAMIHHAEPVQRIRPGLGAASGSPILSDGAGSVCRPERDIRSAGSS